MISYSLNISISSAGVAQLSSYGLSIVVVKQVAYVVTGGASDVAPPYNNDVAWMVLPPMEQNSITWSDTYFLYVTLSPVVPLATIGLSSSTGQSVQPGRTYTYQAGSFDKGTPNSLPDWYGVSNAQSGGSSAAFGLAQQSVINNGTSVLAPINAVPLGYDMSAEFQPADTLWVFVASYTGSGTVILNVPDDACQVEFGGSQQTANLLFDPGTNTFAPQ